MEMLSTSLISNNKRMPFSMEKIVEETRDKQVHIAIKNHGEMRRS
jgi:hypothetical protein